MCAKKIVDDPIRYILTDLRELIFIEWALLGFVLHLVLSVNYRRWYEVNYLCNNGEIKETLSIELYYLRRAIKLKDLLLDFYTTNIKFKASLRSSMLALTCISLRWTIVASKYIEADVCLWWYICRLTYL